MDYQQRFWTASIYDADGEFLKSIRRKSNHPQSAAGKIAKAICDSSWFPEVGVKRKVHIFNRVDTQTVTFWMVRETESVRAYGFEVS